MTLPVAAWDLRQASPKYAFQLPVQPLATGPGRQVPALDRPPLRMIP